MAVALSQAALCLPLRLGVDLGVAAAAGAVEVVAVSFGVQRAFLFFYSTLVLPFQSCATHNRASYAGEGGLRGGYTGCVAEMFVFANSIPLSPPLQPIPACCCRPFRFLKVPAIIRR